MQPTLLFHSSTAAGFLTFADRFLKDVNNAFHLGSGITFHEMVIGVKEVDEVRLSGVFKF